jgi:hypothetical protein
MKQLVLLKTAKDLLLELEKKQDDYGSSIDKYYRKIGVSASFEWKYGSYGSSSVYDVKSIRNINKDIMNKVVNDFINKNFDEVVKLISDAHKVQATKDIDEILKQKEDIEEILLLANSLEVNKCKQ